MLVAAVVSTLLESTNSDSKASYGSNNRLLSHQLIVPQVGMIRLEQDMPTFWAERILILINIFFYVLDPKFLDFQVPKSQNFWSSRSPGLQIPRFPGPQISRFPAAAGGTLRSQPDPSPNAPRDQIHRKGPCCDIPDSLDPFTRTNGLREPPVPHCAFKQL